jgi:hypothetical protein
MGSLHVGYVLVKGCIAVSLCWRQRRVPAIDSVNLPASTHVKPTTMCNLSARARVAKAWPRGIHQTGRLTPFVSEKAAARR